MGRGGEKDLKRVFLACVKNILSMAPPWTERSSLGLEKECPEGVEMQDGEKLVSVSQLIQAPGVMGSH